MSKHTPGPWTWGSDYCGLYGSGKKNEVLTHQSFEGMWLSYGETQEANGRLIAAAPDLLDSAQLALSIAESWIHDQLDGTSYLESAMQSLDPVRAAIAKALGEE